MSERFAPRERERAKTTGEPNEEAAAFVDRIADPELVGLPELQKYYEKDEEQDAEPRHLSDQTTTEQEDNSRLSSPHSTEDQSAPRHDNG